MSTKKIETPEEREKLRLALATSLLAVNSRKLIRKLTRHALRPAARLPTWAKHPAAVALRACAVAVEDVRHVANAKVIPWHDLEQLFVQTARVADVQVRCPFCGNWAPQAEIEELKTYCFGCSVWGQDPRTYAEEQPMPEEEERPT